ncbi:MAG: hypothetical protein IJG86_01950 [Clostridia bacterium]|nr:hypothetical protein [Clostridia bacterium]
MEGFFNGSKELAEFLVDQGADAQLARDTLNEERDAMKREVKEIHGVPHSWNPARQKWEKIDLVIPDDLPTPKALEFFTLAGLVDYINENNEHIIPEDGTRIILQVVDHRTVKLISQPSEFQKNRHTIAYAQAHTPEITFGRYMDTDSFCTELLSKFIETDARKTLFQVAKSMTKEQSATTTDDGVGQQITVREGVSMATTVNFQNPVPLRPRRTFSEVDQPESNFTLRVDKEAKVALFESDGGAWKIDAVNYIRQYLTAQIENPAVIVIA